uniref:DUF1995 domain-containing protein n=1 Tax=Leersia perrieri TaxID=77586 RepID=A0A0D9WIA4_9ORYZ
MAMTLLNPPPSKLAPKPPLPPPSRQFAPPPPPQQIPLHLLSLLRREQLRPVRASSTPPADAPSRSPPSSREEAVSQARSCLAAALRKPLINSALPPRKLKKQQQRQRQTRLRAEIPVVDDSPGSLARLAADVFSPSGLGVSKKASLLLVWPSTDALRSALQEPNVAWGASTAHADLDAVAPAASGCDAAVFLSPGKSQVGKIQDAAAAIDPKPVVLFNPGWSFDEEEDFAAGERGFVGSFNVVYSFTGLEVRGLLSKKRGVLLRFGGESWVLMVEEAADRFKVVSRLKRRPTIGEVETVLYNLMAVNSPVTKSARFLRGIVSNVTGGGKEKQ